MASMDGTHTVGARSGRLLVKTGRTGLGSKAGHDLTIEVTRWEGSVTIDTDNPANSSVSVDAEVGSFEVIEGTGGVKPLTDSDRAEIKKTLQEKILQADRHPTIAFRSTRVGGSPRTFTIDGDLTIVGRTHPVTVRGELSGDQARGAARIAQTEFGIKPYSAFFGALKLADEVAVEFEASLDDE